MKHLVFILFFLLIVPYLNSQNLISNPSFEDIDSCYGQPAGIGFDVFEWSGCTGWSNPIGASSDLWCENPLVGNLTPPQMYISYQYPRSGQNMAGIIINDGIMFNYREYIQNELLQPLINNVVYDIKFYVSGNVQDCMVNQFGVKFLNAKLTDISLLWLTDIVPDVTSDPSQIEYDTLTWQKVKMQYKANGSEKYVIIGNFQDSLNMTYTLPCDTSFWGNLTLGGGYMLIDDVSISINQDLPDIPNVLTPNEDGVNDHLIINGLNCDDWECFIFNRFGIKVAVLNKENPNWYPLKEKDGVYFYIISSQSCDKEKHGFIQLIR